MSIQNWERLYYYIHEYQNLIYDYYSKHAVAFLVTYYNINTETTVWEDEKLFGGYYEKIGDLSGVRWNKYVLLPIYFITEVQTVFEGTETGLIKQNESEIVIPSSYGIQPYHNDIVKFEQEYLKPTNDTYPLFSVTGIEKSANTDRTFWKCRIKTEQSKTTEQLERQISDIFVFYDYTKSVHTIDNAIFLTRLMQKHEGIKGKLTSLYDRNSGFYFV